MCLNGTDMQLMYNPFQTFVHAMYPNRLRIVHCICITDPMISKFVYILSVITHMQKAHTYNKKYSLEDIQRT